jgi:ferrous iron transport protein A
MRRAPVLDYPAYPPRQFVPSMTDIIRLDRARRGQEGLVHSVEAIEDNPVDALELERRLLEFGLVEGARVGMIHEGPLGGDPVVLSVDGMRIALRRHEVRGLSLRLNGTSSRA